MELHVYVIVIRLHVRVYGFQVTIFDMGIPPRRVITVYENLVHCTCI